VTKLGVVGAGTMGAGIAQTGIAAGFTVALYDTQPEALERGFERIRAGLRKSREKGLFSGDEGQAISTQLSAVNELEALADCDVVVEAAVENLEIKQQIFGTLSAACRPDAVLASNTSSIPITAIAAAANDPSQVVGLHFFNPAPLMRLVEVIRAQQSSEATVLRAAQIGRALGKEPILAPDGPGFLVNRCGRPFYGEPLRLLAERVADHEQIDRIMRIAGGFRMGPFELMDLVGLDVNLTIAKSFMELSFGEPRWRPTMLQSQIVASGRLGRKTGRGWYSYDEGAYRPEDRPDPDTGGGDGRRLAIVGAGALGEHLRRRAAAAGFVTADAAEPRIEATIFSDPDVSAQQLQGAANPIVCCAAHSLAFRGIGGVVGFNVGNIPGGGRLAELARTHTTTAAHAEAAEQLFGALGLHTEWVRDGPGLVFDRVFAQIVNEAAFALGAGLASAQDIDTGLTLGLNYPRGAVSWGQAVGWEQIRGTLDGIWNERREERYRPAPALIAAAAGEPMETLI
jgi:3-hydroxybutyryl-CoA dehydrogenase